MPDDDTPPIIPTALPGSWSRAGIDAPPRGPVFGRRFAVASEHAASSLIGLDALRSGANAVDAAIAMSAAQVVLKPYYSQLGGDAFVLIWHRRTGAVECLNAGGRAPRGAALEAFADGIPARGPRASTLPGLVDAWGELHARHGSRPLAESLRPAIELARDGFPVSQRLSDAMAVILEGPVRIDDPDLRAMFLADGARPYRPGETFRQPQLGDTLDAIARDGRDGFYAGRVARAIAQRMREAGGLIDEDDLAQPAAHWHEPLCVTYRGCTVYEQALPSQGIILLQALKTVERFPIGEWSATGPDAVHVMAEATRLAFRDARARIADPLVEDVPVETLLSDEHAERCAAEIDLARAGARPRVPAPTDTTSFVVADEDAVVSFIQSVFWPWGSGFVIPEAGVLMNNRMTGFSTDPASPNRLAPGKRAVHTLNTFLALRDGELIVGGGTPGGDFQVQTNLQTIAGVVDWEMDLQLAIDAPRWATLPRGRLVLERRFPDATFDELRRRGHNVERGAAWDATLSRSQVISTTAGLAAASDTRGEGVALAV